MNIIRHPSVLEELINLSYYIALDDLDAAHRFLDARDETFGQIAQTPLIGATREFKNPKLRDVRLWFVKGFKKYLIFYRPVENGVEILHVVHGSRDYKHLFEDEGEETAE
jgi:toxin ParE1/3/4